MPIYEYVCTECGEPVEKLQRLSDAPLVDCPVCGHASLKRKVSAPSFRLAGSGWYETDFKKEGRRHLAGGGDKSDKHDTHAGHASGKSENDSTSEKSKKKTAGESSPSKSDASSPAVKKKAKADA